MRMPSFSGTGSRPTRTGSFSSRGSARSGSRATSSETASGGLGLGLACPAPDPEAGEIALVENRDHEVVELLGEAHLAVLARGPGLAHHRALHVDADLGQVEIGPDRGPHLPVCITLEDVLV